MSQLPELKSLRIQGQSKSIIVIVVAFINGTEFLVDCLQNVLIPNYSLFILIMIHFTVQIILM